MGARRAPKLQHQRAACRHRRVPALADHQGGVIVERQGGAGEAITGPEIGAVEYGHGSPAAAEEGLIFVAGGRVACRCADCDVARGALFRPRRGDDSQRVDFDRPIGRTVAVDRPVLLEKGVCQWRAPGVAARRGFELEGRLLAGEAQEGEAPADDDVAGFDAFGDHLTARLARQLGEPRFELCLDPR